jgi:diguanylate cyclase (GGDEF)-like protein
VGLQAGAEVARRLARSDALTGLGNRRALDETPTAEAARSARQGTPLAVGLVDLDGLRRINDRFGHVEGDHCLQQAARDRALMERRPPAPAAKLRDAWN